MKDIRKIEEMDLREWRNNLRRSIKEAGDSL